MLTLYNATLFTMDPALSRGTGCCGVLEPGWIVIKDGRIFEIGFGKELPADRGEAVDIGGKIITPGLIDAHTHLGLYEEGRAKEGDDTNEISAPVTPILRALDGISPRDPGLKDARENGVTVVCTLPGSTNVIGGIGVALKTVGSVVDEMVISFRSGLKVAFGENPKRTYGERKKSPSTRMAVAALLREALVKAQVSKSSDNERDLVFEVFKEVLDGRMPLRVHAHRADDIMTAIRVAEEFSVPLVLEHCTEGHYVAREIAARGIPAIYGPMFIGRVKQELGERLDSTPAVLSEAGVKLALSTDHPEISIKYLPLCAAVAAREGLPKSAALQAITINAAEILGIADRVGSLSPGKDADLVVWSGDPIDVGSRVEMVMIDGNMVFDRREGSPLGVS